MPKKRRRKPALIHGEIDSQIRQLAGGDDELAGTLDFAEDLMSDAADWWQRLPIEHQQELQSLIFPSGVIYADGVCRTAEEPPFSGLYSAFNLASVRLVDLTGFEPVTS